MITIRKAEEKDISAIIHIINQAKQYLAEKKIPQWQSGYPEEIDIEEDLQNGGGYVAEEDGDILGYCFIKIMQDHNYDVIENGHWLNEEPYAVLHRTCVHNDAKGKGVAGRFVETAESLCANVRADTHVLNQSMRKMLEKHGFVPCGTVYMEDGTPRIGYQKKAKN